MLEALLKWFGVGGEESKKSGSSPRKSGKREKASGSVQNIGDMVGFVGYVTKLLVDYPDEVKVDTVEKDGDCVIQISCRKEDIGKVVGKKGKTIMAIRSLVSGAAGRLQKRISVEVLD